MNLNPAADCRQNQTAKRDENDVTGKVAADVGIRPTLIETGNRAPKIPDVGDKIPFGPYLWRVLQTNGDSALIITEDIIKLRGYHTTHTVDMTWEACELRHYLNTTFYHSFNAAEQRRIIPMSVKNADNAIHGTKGGNDTTDHVFLLSEAEAEVFFKDDSDRVAYHDGEAQWWWLRSPGRVQKGAARVNRQGLVYVKANFTNYHAVGVRPVLWLKF